MKLVRKRQLTEIGHLRADLDRVERELNELEEENPLFIDEVWLEQKRVLETHRDRIEKYIREIEAAQEAGE